MRCSKKIGGICMDKKMFIGLLLVSIVAVSAFAFGYQSVKITDATATDDFLRANDIPTAFKEDILTYAESQGILENGKLAKIPKKIILFGVKVTAFSEVEDTIEEPIEEESEQQETMDPDRQDYRLDSYYRIYYEQVEEAEQEAEEE